MNQVLHLQSRAYPTNHRGVDSPTTTLSLSGMPDLALRLGTLGSLAYRSQQTLEIDLTPALVPQKPLLGSTIVWSRMRVLPSAAVVLTIAMTHEDDLAGRDLQELCRIDALIDRARREQDADVVTAVFAGLLESGALRDPQPWAGWRGSAADLRLARWEAVRYNCHVVTPTERWQRDSRVKCGRLEHCTILLPYTYQWTTTDTTENTILDLLEPADLAVAERSVLAGAMGQSLAILEEISTPGADRLPPVTELRRHVDRVRSCYHRLDSYRYNSAQGARGVFLAARSEMAMDEAQEHTNTVLAQVAESLRAEVTERTMALDGKLNRLAAAFTVATGGALVLDVVQFAGGGELPALHWRTLILALLFVTSSVVLALLFLRTGRTRASD